MTKSFDPVFMFNLQNNIVMMLRENSHDIKFIYPILEAGESADSKIESTPPPPTPPPVTSDCHETLTGRLSGKYLQIH